LQCFADASCTVDYGTPDATVDCARGGGSGQYFSIGWCDWVGRGSYYDAEIQSACGDDVVVVLTAGCSDAPSMMISGTCTDGQNISITASGPGAAFNGSIECGTQFGSGVFEWGNVDADTYTLQSGSQSIQVACGGGGDIAGCMTSGYDNYNLSASISDDSCACNENRTWDAMSQSCVDVVVCSDPGDACANSGGT
jgi:hypothetical protein